jgi:hypothetical protein
MPTTSPQAPSWADQPRRRPQDISSVSRVDGRAPGLATTGAPTITQPRLTGWSRAYADDIDRVVVDRLVDGQPADCTAWERREAVVRLRRRNLSHRQIAQQLRMPERQVTRDLDRAGLSDTGLLRRRRDNARQRREHIPDLHATGALIAEIGLLFAVSPDVVRRDYRQLGLPTPGAGGAKRCRSRAVLVQVYGQQAAS